MNPRLRIPFPCLKLCILQFCARANNILFCEIKKLLFRNRFRGFWPLSVFSVIGVAFFRNKLLCCERGQHEMPIAAVSLPLFSGLICQLETSPPSPSPLLFNFFPLFRYFAEFMKVFSLFPSSRPPCLFYCVTFLFRESCTTVSFFSFSFIARAVCNLHPHWVDTFMPQCNGKCIVLHCWQLSQQ